MYQKTSSGGALSESYSSVLKQGATFLTSPRLILIKIAANHALSKRVSWEGNVGAAWEDELHNITGSIQLPWACQSPTSSHPLLKSSET